MGASPSSIDQQAAIDDPHAALFQIPQIGQLIDMVSPVVNPITLYVNASNTFAFVVRDGFWDPFWAAVHDTRDGYFHFEHSEFGQISVRLVICEQWKMWGT